MIVWFNLQPLTISSNIPIKITISYALPLKDAFIEKFQRGSNKYLFLSQHCKQITIITELKQTRVSTTPVRQGQLQHIAKPHPRLGHHCILRSFLARMHNPSLQPGKVQAVRGTDCTKMLKAKLKQRTRWLNQKNGNNNCQTNIINEL